MKKRKLKGFQGIFFAKEVEEKLIALQYYGLDNVIENMHVTFKVGEIQKYPEDLIEKEFSIKIVGYASDGKNSGFKIELPDKLKPFYRSCSIAHIAVSIGEVDGIKARPEDTARLDFKQLKEPVEIKGKLGYFIYGIGKCMDNFEINEYEQSIIPDNIRVLLIPKYMNKEELTDAKIIPNATVEAEYGQKVIKGKDITLAHHAKMYEKNPAPSNTIGIDPLEDNSTIVVSHLDLDTIGGIASLIGRKKEDRQFWEAVEFIDLNGLHNLFQVDEKSRQKYIAYLAYHAKHKNPRFTEITDVTDIVLEHIEIINRIIGGDKSLIKEGLKWEEETKRKIEDSLVFENDIVRVFNSQDGIYCSSSFYSEKQGKVIPCTITRNGKLNSLTVAMSDRGKIISAKELVQELWGDETGGYPAIAGSPRGYEVTKNDIMQLVNLVDQKYKNINEMNEMIYFESDNDILDD